jgi:hypothetical protein
MLDTACSGMHPRSACPASCAGLLDVSRWLGAVITTAGSRALAERCLAELPRRWRHVQGVGHRAEHVAEALRLPDGALVGAAWLHDVAEKITAVAGPGGMGWRMAGMLTQLPLPLLPAGAAEIAPGVGLVAGEDGGGLVSVHGLATFAWDARDEAGRRLAAMQLVRLRAVSQASPHRPSEPRRDFLESCRSSWSPVTESNRRPSPYHACQFHSMASRRV